MNVMVASLCENPNEQKTYENMVNRSKLDGNCRIPWNAKIHVLPCLAYI